MKNIVQKVRIALNIVIACMMIGVCYNVRQTRINIEKTNYYRHLDDSIRHEMRMRTLNNQ